MNNHPIAIDADVNPVSIKPVIAIFAMIALGYVGITEWHSREAFAVLTRSIGPEATATRLEVGGALPDRLLPGNAVGTTMNGVPFKCLLDTDGRYRHCTPLN